MIEMQQVDDLKYTNEIPRWARIVQYGVLGLLVLIILSLAALAVFVFTTEDGWILSLLLLGMCGLIGWVAKGIKTIIQVNRKFIIRTELREEGYYSFIQNTKTGESAERLIPYEQMNEVLIGRKLRYVTTPTSRRIHRYMVGAQLIVQWTDENRERRYFVFGHEDPMQLKQWAEMFQKKGVPMYITEENIGFLTPSQLQKDYGEIPREPFDPESTVLRTGYMIYRDIPKWENSETRAKKEARRERLDAWLFRPLYAVLLLANFLIALLWMPNWALEDGGFADSSPSFNVYFATLLLMAFAGTYWRKQVKWFRPVLDTSALIVVHLIGFAVSLIFQASSSDVFFAIMVECITFGLFLYGLFLIVRVTARRWFW